MNETPIDDKTVMCWMGQPIKELSKEDLIRALTLAGHEVIQLRQRLGEAFTQELAALAGRAALRESPTPNIENDALMVESAIATLTFHTDSNNFADHSMLCDALRGVAKRIRASHPERPQSSQRHRVIHAGCTATGEGSGMVNGSTVGGDVLGIARCVYAKHCPDGFEIVWGERAPAPEQTP